MRLGESLAELFPEQTEDLFVVETTVHDDLVVAVSTCEKEESS
jgi:stalled ribosome rescue protein Dom34